MVVEGRVVSLSLNQKSLSAIEKHRREGGFLEKRRVPQWEGTASFYNPSTKRIHVHKDTPQKQGMQRYRFESTEGVSNTLTTHTLKFWDLGRHASGREIARLQGFPDWFSLPPQRQAEELFGNAICVPVAEHCIRSLLLSSQASPHLPHPPSFSFLDLCAGVGGFHVASLLASESARCPHPPTCVGFSEVKEIAIRSYSTNFPGVPNLGDLREEGKEWPSCDVVFAGFPCQPFSKCLKTDRNSHSERDIFSHLPSILQKTGCDYFVFENVATLETIGKECLLSLLSSLESIGFRVERRVYDAYDFGVPQRRKRLFLVGSKTFHPSLPVPPPQRNPPPILKDILEPNPSPS